MPEQPLPKRKTVQIRGYDYAAPNRYFVTICVDGRRSIPGEVVGEGVKLSGAGHIVAETWDRLPDLYPSISLENFVVMPNHVHGIVVLGEALPTPALPHPRKHALSEIIRGFKSMSAREINRTMGEGRAMWQRGFYEHIIRNDADLARIRETSTTIRSLGRMIRRIQTESRSGGSPTRRQR